LAALKAMPDIETKSEYEVRDNLNKRFTMNYVYDVTKDDIKVVKHGNYLKVQIEYETVAKIAGNLSVLASLTTLSRLVRSDKKA